MQKQRRHLSCWIVFSHRPWGLFFATYAAVLWFLGQSLPPHANAAETGQKLLAGAAVSNITPWLGISINGYMQDRKASHIHDELYARCLVLDNGLTRLAIVICDSCIIPREVFDQAKQMVQKHTKLPPAHMLMAATHTHSAPTAAPAFQSVPDPEYQHFLTVRIADAVRRIAVCSRRSNKEELHEICQKA